MIGRPGLVNSFELTNRLNKKGKIEFIFISLFFIAENSPDSEPSSSIRRVNVFIFVVLFANQSFSIVFIRSNR